MEKIYVLVEDFQEDFDFGTTTLMITCDYHKVRDHFENLLRKKIEEHPEWDIDDNRVYFFQQHHPDDTGDFYRLQIQVWTSNGRDFTEEML